MANDIETLLGWLRQNSRLFSWDMIVALDKDALNALLLQVYIGRFDGKGFREPFTAELNVDSNQKRFLQDFVLDIPRLSFDNAALDNSMASLSMKVISGSDVAVQARPEGHEVTRLEWIQPMEGATLKLALHLRDVGGSVVNDRRLMLDLKNSDDFTLDFDDPNAQRLGGMEFAALFRRLPDAERVFELGQITPSPDAILQPQSFRLRTQSDGSSTGAGAVVLFISMQDQHNVEPPGSGGDFRYLIPTSAHGYRATVMLSPQRLAAMAFVTFMKQTLRPPVSPQFRWRDRLLTGVSIANASFEVAASTDKGRECLGGGIVIDYQVATEPFVVSTVGDGLMELSVESGSMQLNWPCEGKVAALVSTWKNGDINHDQVRMEFPVKGTLVWDMRLMETPTVHYKVMDKRFIPDSPPQEIPAADERTSGPIIDLIIELIVQVCVAAIVKQQLLKPFERLFEQLAENDLGERLPDLVRETIKLNMAETITEGDLYAPADLVLFAHVGQPGQALSITPVEPRVAIGGQCQFIASPAGAVTWTVEPVSGSGPVVGTIVGGLYSVPSHARFDGTFLRERVKATRDGKHAYALVTVTRDNLSIAPLVQVVSARKDVRLDAGSTIAGATFNWAFSGEAGEGRLSASHGSRVNFTAGAELGRFPQMRAITVSAGGASREAIVILRPTDDSYTMTLRVIGTDTVKRQVTLRCFDPMFGEQWLEWKIERGEGQGGRIVSAAGDQVVIEIVQAPVPRCLVVSCEMKKASSSEPAGELKMRGHFVVPVPLAEYQTVYQHLQRPPATASTRAVNTAASSIPKPIIEWLQDNPDMLHWDMITALPLERVQGLVQKAYERRVADGSLPQQMQGSYHYEDLSLDYLLDNYRVDSPRLKIDAPSLTAATVKLSLAMESGAQLSIDDRGDIFTVFTHRTVNALTPTITLPLEYAEGQVRVDLRNGSRYDLHLGQGEMAPDMGRTLAQQMFQRVDKAQSTLSVGRVSSSVSNPFLNPGDMRIRSQASATDGRQAVLLLSSLEPGQVGFDPPDGMGFPALLAADPADRDTCTVLISRRAAHRTAYGQAIRAVLENAAWVPTYDGDRKQLLNMTANSGAIPVDPGSARDQQWEFESGAFELGAAADAAALVVAFDDSFAEQRWQPRFSVPCRYRRIGADEWTETTLSLPTRLDYRFSLRTENGEELADISPLPAPKADVAQETVPEAIVALAEYSVRRGFLNALSRRLTAKVGASMAALLRVETDRVFQATSMSIPGHLALQGRLQSRGARLRIVEQAVELTPGEQQRFTTEPARAGLRWLCERLADYPQDIGQIDASTGVYTAPGFQALAGSTLRVRVVALDPASGARHDALVTVLGTLISVQPTLHVIPRADASKSVVLQAFKKAVSSLSWQLLNVEGDSGATLQAAPDGASASYQVGPVNSDAYCSIDRVVTTGQDALHNPVGLPAEGVLMRVYREQLLKIVLQAEPVQNTQQLSAMISGDNVDATWYLPLQGPGSIDASGLYRADPASTDSFAIVRAYIVAQDGRRFDGHLVLPLPLGRFAGVHTRRLAVAQAEREHYANARAQAQVGDAPQADGSV